jgi:hypothetical protein
LARRTRFWRLARRIGKKKALLAVAHSIVIAIWHMHTDQCDYVDLGVDWWDKRLNPRTETDRLKRRLEALGHRVILEPAA